MKKILLFIIIGLMFISSNGFSQSDVFIDSTGNTYTGVSNPWSKFKVDSETDRDAIEGMAVGSGVGIYGGNTTFNYYGILGAPSAGVYGYSATGNGNAGLFDGNMQINGNLTLTGTLTGYSETDPVFSGSPSSGITVGQISNWDTAYGWGDHASAGYDTTYDPWIGTSDVYILSGNVGIGTSSPSETLTVAGTIESTSGGVKFPDATIQTSASPTYLRTVIVSPVTGDAIASGTALLSALAGITGATATTPYLLKIEPGIYDLGNNGLAMQSYIDIEGSGENITTITSTHCSSSRDATSATVSGADNAEIRFLTLENQEGGGFCLAIYNSSASPGISNVTATASDYGVYNDSSSPTMTEVTVTVSGGGGSKYGVYNDSSSPTMTGVTVTASNGDENYGVYNNSSSPIMTGVTITVSGASFGPNDFGVWNENSSSPIIKNSSINSTYFSMYTFGSTVKVAASEIDGIVDGGSYTCVGAYDGNFNALGTNCL